MDGWTDDEVKTVFPLPLWFTMMVALIVVLPGCATSPQMPPAVQAVDIPLHILDKPEVTMRLMDKPCVDPVAQMLSMQLPAELHPKLRAIESTWLMRDGSRREFAGCWVEVSKELAGVDGYFVAFSDQTYGVVPKTDFLKTKGAVWT